MQETFRSTGRDVMICIDAVWQEKFLVLHSSSKLQVAHLKKLFLQGKRRERTIFEVPSVRFFVRAVKPSVRPCL